MRVRSLGQEGPLEEAMATHSGILAWRIPGTEEPDGLKSTGLQSRTRLKALSMHTHIGTEWMASQDQITAIFSHLLPGDSENDALIYPSVSYEDPTMWGPLRTV